MSDRTDAWHGGLSLLLQVHARPPVGRSRNGTWSDRAHELHLRGQALPPVVRDLRPVHRRRLVPPRRRRCNRVRSRVQCRLDRRRRGLRGWDGLRCLGRIGGLDRSRGRRGNRGSGHRFCDRPGVGALLLGWSCVSRRRLRRGGRNVSALGDRHRRRVEGSRLDRRSLRFGLRIRRGGRVHRLFGRASGIYARLRGCAWLGPDVLRSRLWQRVRYGVRCRSEGLRRSRFGFRDRRLGHCVGFRRGLGRRGVRLRHGRRQADPRR